MITAILAAICLCGEAPERANDFFWENDKVGFRAYGPGDPHVWSGFDVFNKMTNAEATCGEVLHNHDKCGNWHVTPFKGILDNYTMGASRGVGGIAMFADGEWKTFPDWKECRVIAVSDEVCEFELVYPAFSAAGEMTCRITLKRGERFFKNTVSFKKKIRNFHAEVPDGSGCLGTIRRSGCIAEIYDFFLRQLLHEIRDAGKPSQS